MNRESFNVENADELDSEFNNNNIDNELSDISSNIDVLIDQVSQKTTSEEKIDGVLNILNRLYNQCLKSPGFSNDSASSTNVISLALYDIDNIAEIRAITSKYSSIEDINKKCHSLLTCVVKLNKCLLTLIPGVNLVSEISGSELKLRKIQEQIFFSGETLKNLFILVQNTNPHFTLGDASRDGGILRFMAVDSEGVQLSQLQEFLIYALEQCRIMGYGRKDNKFICKMKMIPMPDSTDSSQVYQTGFWENVEPIEDFIYRISNSTYNYVQWANLTSATSNIPSAIRQLSFGMHFQLPDIVADRHVFAFKNGIYDVRRPFEFRFFKNKIIPLPVVANFFDAEFDIEWIQNFQVSYINNAISSTTTFTGLSGSASSNTNANFRIPLASHPPPPVVLPSARDISGADKNIKIESTGWKSINTPDFQKILDHQYDPSTCEKTAIVNNDEEAEDCQLQFISHFEEQKKQMDKVKMILYAMMGRGLFSVGEMDNLQVFAFYEGVAGTGKSGIIDVQKAFYRFEDIGIMSDNVSEKFGMSELHGKFVVLGSEIKQDFSMPSAILQQCVSGESVSLQVKHEKSASVKKWEAPIYFASNEFPRAFKGSNGAIARRCLTFLFKKKVYSIDTTLKDRIMLEVPKLLVKCNLAYHQMINDIGTKDIWSYVPDIFKEAQTQLNNTTNVLEAFLSSGLFLFETSYLGMTGQVDSQVILRSDQSHVYVYVPEQVFLSKLKEFCHAGNLRMPEWTQDTYGYSFLMKKLKRVEVDPSKFKYGFTEDLNNHDTGNNINNGAEKRRRIDDTRRVNSSVIKKWYIFGCDFITNRNN